MKRRVIPIVLALCLLLSGCGAVSETEEAISRIGFVTLNSQDEIELAEQLYSGLPSRQKGKVENRLALFDARAQYDVLKQTVDDTITLISSLSTGTEFSEEALRQARSAYDALADQGYASYVSEYYPILEAAENQYVYAQYQSGQQLLSKKKYQEALDIFDAILTAYPNCGCVPELRQGAADALAGLADQQIRSGDLESALTAVEEMTERYGATEAVNTLREKILKKLTQQRPSNGKSFNNTVGRGEGRFTVSAGTQDACIKLEDITDPSKYILFYVRAGEEATVNVKDGQYKVKYTCGEYWFSQNSMFGRNASFIQAEDILSFTTTREGSYIYYSTASITLYTVTGGNLETSSISPDSF